MSESRKEFENLVGPGESLRVMGLLKRGATRSARAWSFGAALLVYGFIISVARAHDPRGVLALLGL